MEVTFWHPVCVSLPSHDDVTSRYRPHLPSIVITARRQDLLPRMQSQSRNRTQIVVNETNHLLEKLTTYTIYNKLFYCLQKMWLCVDRNLLSLIFSKFCFYKWNKQNEKKKEIPKNNQFQNFVHHLLQHKLIVNHRIFLMTSAKSTGMNSKSVSALHEDFFL